MLALSGNIWAICVHDRFCGLSLRGRDAALGADGIHGHAGAVVAAHRTVTDRRAAVRQHVQPPDESGQEAGRNDRRPERDLEHVKVCSRALCRALDARPVCPRKFVVISHAHPISRRDSVDCPSLDWRSSSGGRTGLNVQDQLPAIQPYRAHPSAASPAETPPNTPNPCHHQQHSHRRSAPLRNLPYSWMWLHTHILQPRAFLRDLRASARCSS